MNWLKKYIAIFIVLSIFPVIWIVGRMFVLDASTEIYSYIPQESDIVIEVNNPNFIEEFAYQRVFNEAYVMEKINIEDAAIEDFKTGVDYFSKIVLFREQWADEDVWIAVIGYTDKANFEQYIKRRYREANIQFGEKHAIVQLSKSKNQALLDEHLKEIANKEVKPFTSRISLKDYFIKDKEINCYFIPPSTNANNQLIDGYLNFDFKQDHIDIQGDFTPVSTFDQHPTIAYSVDENAAFSMRSSMNIFNSIFWFSSEKIDDVPEYDQMALDYNGVKIFLVDKDWGYEFPFKTMPEVQVRFDISEGDRWQAFFDSLESQDKIRIDTTVGYVSTKQGAFFKYKIDDNVFELSHSGISLSEMGPSNLYFDFQMKLAPLIDNTSFGVDEDNPPSETFQFLLMSAADEMLEELHVFANIEEIRFQMLKENNDMVTASGKVQMANREGQSVIESMIFVTEAMFFIKDF